MKKAEFNHRDKNLELTLEQISRQVEQDRQKIIHFFSKLTQCKTPSIPGDTRSAANLIKEFLDKEGLCYQEIKVNPIMPNIISVIDTGRPGRHLMFNGHLDVMPAGNEPGWTDSPWSGKIADGKVWGRGTSDMKAGITAMLFAYAYLAKMQEQFAGKLSITLVSDEETGYERGTGFLFEEMEKDMIADCVLAGEPSGTNAISFASKGYIQFTVNIQTRGAIAGYSNESQSAIAIAASIIQGLKELENIEVTTPQILSDMLSDPQQRSRYEARRGKSEAGLLDKITVDITTIQGGDLLSVIAPECSFTVAVVLPVGTDPYLVFRQADKIIAGYPEAELTLEGISVADISDPNHEMIGILQDTVTMQGWEKPEPVPDIAISDCRHWRYRNIPAFWYGADGSRCSAANEYVDIEELLHLVRTYTLAALQYLTVQAKALHCKDGHAARPKPIVPFKPISPEIRSIPPVYAAYIKEAVNSFKSADLDTVRNELLNTLYARLTKSGILAAAAAIVIMEYKNTGSKKQIIVTAAYPVSRNITFGKDFEVMELPGIQSAAVTVHRGLESTTTSWSELRRFAAGQGYKDTGVYREYYIVNAPNPPEQWSTELQLPLEPLPRKE